MGTGKSLHWSTELPEIYNGNSILNKYVFSLLRKVAIVSEDLIVTGVDSRLLAQLHLPI